MLGPTGSQAEEESEKVRVRSFNRKMRSDCRTLMTQPDDMSG